MRALALALSVVPTLAAQSISVRPDWEPASGYVALQQAVRDAATDNLALIVASHPDDRYVLPAAYLRFERGWRVAVLLMTRGEGGQNSKGPEIGDELGWRRTLESEACAALLDARVYYLNRQDTGFCRTADEALELWGRDDTIRNLARLVREVRPDVVLTTHHPDEDHGHDLAVIAALPGALAMAADPAVDLEGLPPIEVAKAFRGPGASELERVRCELPVQDLDPFRGDTFSRLAYAALKKHESQEPIRPMAELFEEVVRLYPLRPADSSSSSEWLLDEDLPSLFTGFEPTPATNELQADLASLADEIGAPAGLQQVVDLYEAVLRLELPAGTDAAVRRERRLDALERVLLHGSGFRVTTAPASAVAVMGQAFPLEMSVQVGRGGLFRDLRIEAAPAGRLDIAAADRARLAELRMNGSLAIRASYAVPPGDGDHRAWLKRLFAADTFEPPVRLACRVALATASESRLDLAFEVMVPVDLRPPVELEVAPRAILLTRDNGSATFRVCVTRHSAEPLQGRLEVLGRADFALNPPMVEVDMGATLFRDYLFDLHVPGGLRPGVFNLHVRLGEHRSIVPVHKVDVVVPDKIAVGLVPGVDDTAETVLRACLGADRFELLGEERLATHSLDDFAAIVIDIRALRESESTSWKAARAAFPRLLEFVRRGGRLVVFYHKDTEFNPESAGFQGWPEPLQIGKNRVTREDSPVEVLAPQHLLLNRPNEIKPEDWDGWVQERGLYYPERYATRAYEEIVAMADPGHEKLRSAVLYARYGAGEYVYCALALYRQLDFFHPGACRIFANLVFPDPAR